MDEQALIRAAEITLRRAILENFPPGKERGMLAVALVVDTLPEDAADFEAQRHH
jgi:hypothetical protein